jgi:hypothetical protein
VRVLERHPECVTTLPNWVWLDTPMKVLSVAERLLKFTDKRPV